MANEGMCDSALPSRKDLLRNHRECSQQTGFSSQLLQGLPPPLRLTLPEGHLSWRHLPSVREEGGMRSRHIDLMWDTLVSFVPVGF